MSGDVKWISRRSVRLQRLVKFWWDYGVFYLFLLVGIGLVPFIGFLFEHSYSNDHFSRSGGAMIAWAIMWVPLVKQILHEKQDHAEKMVQMADKHNPQNESMKKIQKGYFSHVASDTKMKSRYWLEAEVFILFFGTVIWAYGGLLFDS